MGKSAVQKVLSTAFQIKAVDDGDVIRRHCSELFDVPLSTFQTQEGKMEKTVIQDVVWQNRKILGEYAQSIEDKFGDQAIPNWAIRSALADWPQDRYQGVKGYSFGSVRKKQGQAYLNRGGFVLEITRKGVEQSENIWDNHDPTLVSATYQNNTDSLEELTRDFSVFFEDVVRPNIYREGLSKHDAQNRFRAAS